MKILTHIQILIDLPLDTNVDIAVVDLDNADIDLLALEDFEAFVDLVPLVALDPFVAFDDLVPFGAVICRKRSSE